MARKWRACGWSVVQVEFDEELGPRHGMYGSMDAELELQRTIKRAELTAFPCLLKKVIGPSRCMSTTKELLMGFGKEKENASTQRLAMLTCCKKNCGKSCTCQSHFSGGRRA